MAQIQDARAGLQVTQPLLVQDQGRLLDPLQRAAQPVGPLTVLSVQEAPSALNAGLRQQMQD